MRTLEEGFLQVKSDGSGQKLAFGVGNLATVENRDDLILLDDVAELFAQLRHRAYHLRRNTRHAILIERHDAGGCERLTDRRFGRSGADFDLGCFDLALGHSEFIVVLVIVMRRVLSGLRHFSTRGFGHWEGIGGAVSMGLVGRFRCGDRSDRNA